MVDDANDEVVSEDYKDDQFFSVTRNIKKKVINLVRYCPFFETSDEVCHQ